MRWMDLEHDAPRLGDIARARLVEPGVLLVVTVRLDGTPRLSPVEPLLLEGDLWLSMMWESQKAIDLSRDDRVLIHSITTSRDGREGEAKLRGRAIEVEDPDQRKTYCDAVAVPGLAPRGALLPPLSGRHKRSDVHPVRRHGRSTGDPLARTRGVHPACNFADERRPGRAHV